MVKMVKAVIICIVLVFFVFVKIGIGGDCHNLMWDQAMEQMQEIRNLFSRRLQERELERQKEEVLSSRDSFTSWPSKSHKNMHLQ